MDALFLVNPDSQTVKTKGSLLGKVCYDGDVVTEYIRDFTALPDLMRKAAETGCQHICIEGGDGTTHGVMTAFMTLRDAFKTEPRFILVPGGMTNQVAGNIGIKKRTPAYIQDLLATGGKNTQPTRLLHLGIEGASSQYGFLFSSGGIPAATEYCKEKMHGRGIGGSAAVAATILRGVAGSRTIRDEMMPPTPISLGVNAAENSAQLDDEHLASLVTTLPGLMLRLDPFWGKGDAPLRVTFARANARRLLPHMFGTLMGRSGKNRHKDGIESYRAETLTYKYNGPVVMDGEKIDLPNGQLTITATPPVTFLA